MNKKHAEGVSSYNATFLDCRENHLWRWLTDWNIVRGPGGRLIEFTRLKRCDNCKTLCHRTYDGTTGRVIRTRYSYPDGYLATRENPIDAGTARLEQLRRANLIT